MAARPKRRLARHEGGAGRNIRERPRERGEGDLRPEKRRRTALRLAQPALDDGERLLAAYDEAMGIALRALEETFVETDGSWAERMAAAIATLFELAAANPEQANLCVVEIFEAGGPGLERRDRWMSRFMRLCEAAYAHTDSPEAPTRLMPQVSAGAIFELIRTHVTDERLDRLPAALPTATLIVLSPMVGRDEARRVAEALVP